MLGDGRHNLRPVQLRNKRAIAFLGMSPNSFRATLAGYHGNSAIVAMVFVLVDLEQVPITARTIAIGSASCLGPRESQLRVGQVHR